MLLQDDEWAKWSDREISGFSKQRSYDGFSEMTNDYTVYFVIRFSKPFKSLNGWRHPRTEQGASLSSTT